jgi:hypothetical protein
MPNVFETIRRSSLYPWGRSVRIVMAPLFAVVVGACSAPVEEGGSYPREPVAEVQEEFSGIGIDRLIPLRIVLWKQNAGDPDHLQLDWLHQSVQTANTAFRNAGVQFYVRSFEPKWSPIFYNADNLAWRTWGEVKSSLRSVIPEIPINAYSDWDGATARGWLYIAASSSYAKGDELIVWVPAVVGGESESSFPWTGRGIIMANGLSFIEARTLTHELGHNLGLAHTFEVSSQPDPETGGSLGLGDYFDLVYGTGSYPNSLGPVLFDSKEAVLAYPGQVRGRNWSNGAGDNCTVSSDQSCTVTCTLWAYNGGQTNTYMNFQTGHPVVDGSLGFKFAGDNPPTTYKRGLNAMAYFYGQWCGGKLNLTASQVQLVRKYLRFPMVQTCCNGGSYIGTPNNTTRDILGARQADPLHRLDFDEDGKRDIGVYTPPTSVGATGKFSILLSSLAYNPQQALVRSFGTLGDVPVPADYDGDGKTDIAVFRTSGPNGTDPGTSLAYWLYCPSSQSHNCTTPQSLEFGSRADIPIPGTDMDGNPATGEIAVYHPYTYTVYWKVAPWASATVQARTFAASQVGGTVYAALVDSDQKSDLVFYGSNARAFRVRSSTSSWNTETLRLFSSAQRGSYPVRRSSSGKEVLAVYDPTTAMTHTMWSPLTSSAITSCSFGQPGDTAVSTSIDVGNDGKTDMLLLSKPTSSGTVTYTLYETVNTTCSGWASGGSFGGVGSNRVVLFTGQDATGDGKPDLWALDTHTMTWRYHDSVCPSCGSWTNITHGDAWDIPL